MSDYKVTIGKIAKTILYEDSQRVIRFGMDVTTSDDPSKKALSLERLNISGRLKAIEDENLKITEQKRLELAFDRVKQYLVLHGYQVKVWPDDFKSV